MELDVEGAVPDQRLAPGFKRWLAALVGLAAISAALLAWVEAESGHREDQALVDASRRALDVFVVLGASGPRFQFEVDSARRSTTLTARSTARSAATSTDLLPLQIALAQSVADNEASRRLLEVAEALADVPESARGLDVAASEAIRVDSEEDVEPLYDAQDRALADAETHGTRQQRAMYGLSLVAVAASLLGLAGLLGSGRGGRLALATASGGLVVALLVGFSGFLA